MSVCNICGKSFIPYYEFCSSQEITIDGKSFFICSDCSIKFHGDAELKNILIHGSQSSSATLHPAKD